MMTKAGAMTFIFEISKPFQAKPFIFNGPIMFRLGWLWFSVGIIKISIRQLCESSWEWARK